MHFSLENYTKPSQEIGLVCDYSKKMGLVCDYLPNALQKQRIFAKGLLAGVIRQGGRKSAVPRNFQLKSAVPVILTKIPRPCDTMD